METSYKDTLFLPKTDFPMQAGLAQKEPKMAAWWEEKQIFSKVIEQNQRNGGVPFVLHDGPPYANGHIHLGHVLNKVLKDIIVKHRNMIGQPTDFIPGWDCHGLPIELQVVKKLGDKRKSMSVAQFRDECRKYAGEFLDIQRNEFKRLGILAHWDTPYLTMKYTYQASIVRELAKCAKAGFVYKDKKPIHWCISCATALAEAEIEYDEHHKSPSVYVYFPLDALPETLSKKLKADAAGILIWTTTPWTLPANLAIALHPEFDYVAVDVERDGKKFVTIVAEGLLDDLKKIPGFEKAAVRAQLKGKELEGLTYVSHLNGRKGKVLLADYVTLEQGTGAVHTAPGHGYDDYITGLKNNLEIYAPVDDYGRFVEGVTDLAKTKVWDANPKIIEMLKARGFLWFDEVKEHSYPICWRCKKPVIFRATPQWFVSMEKNDLRKKSLAEIDRVSWVPPWGRDRIHGMIENRPDWCLSRQRTWGVPIPAVYCESCNHVELNQEIIENAARKISEVGANCWYSDDVTTFLPKDHRCAECGSKAFRKETDILDVWFDSGVSFAAVGNEFKNVTFPVDLYLEGSDQHRGWFHSALLTSVMTRGKAPYKTVLTHGFVVDGKGYKMSKSTGNYISAQDAIAKSGAEILRLWVCAEDYRNDIRISPEIMQRLTEAYRKIRNTMRFMLGALGDFHPDEHTLPAMQRSETDRFILDRFDRLVEKVQQAFAAYEFHTIYHAIYNFCIVELSSLYLDILKDRLYCEGLNDAQRRASQATLFTILRGMTTLMAPILSVTAEEVWSHLPAWKGKPESVFLEHLPQPRPEFRDDVLFETFNGFLNLRADVAKALELARAGKQIGQSLEAKVILKDSPTLRKLITDRQEGLPFWFIVSQVEIVAHEPTGLIVHKGENTQGLVVAIEKAQFKKCVRCWNYREGIGDDAAHPEVCPRCSQVLKSAA